MTFATRMQNTASRLLTTYGESITVTRMSQGNFVPSTGAINSGVISSFEILAHPSAYTKQEIDGINVLFGDVKILAYSAVEILVNDVVELDDRNYRVQSVERVKAQGSVIIYKVQVRV